MSNVFSNTSFVVLSVMENYVGDGLVGATGFVQRLPETDYPQIMTVSFPSADFDAKDFQVQESFNANVASNIQAQIDAMPSNNVSFVAIKSNLSSKSYQMTAVEI